MTIPQTPSAIDPKETQMKTKILSVAAFASLSTFSAYAFAGCGGMKSAEVHHQMFGPAVRFSESAPMTRGSYMKMGSYTHDSAKAYKTGGYGYGKSQAKSSNADIVDTAVSAGDFNTLVAAVQEAGLVDTLKGNGPYTVFAPTDEAFAKLPDGILEGLLADKEQLAKVLTYHVVPGKVMSSDIANMQSLNTVEGSNISTSTLRVTKADIMTSNGVIHVIDEVLIPQS
jgi:uncharacterized surface protein with fasciclin (FAS1) repeats